MFSVKEHNAVLIVAMFQVWFLYFKKSSPNDQSCNIVLGISELKPVSSGLYLLCIIMSIVNFYSFLEKLWSLYGYVKISSEPNRRLVIWKFLINRNLIWESFGFIPQHWEGLSKWNNMARGWCQYYIKIWGFNLWFFWK